MDKSVVDYWTFSIWWLLHWEEANLEKSHGWAA